MAPLESHVAAVVVAAGEGRRMGAERPKQFLPLGHRAVFLHSLEFFLHLPEAERVCLVLGEQALDGEPARAARTLAAHWGKPLLLAGGGARRQDSALAGLRALPPETDIVLVHDAARPFPPIGATREAIAAARQCGGAILASPATDTVKEVGASGLRIERTLDRSRLWMAQTPQVFRFADLLSAMETAERDGVDLTDEAMAFERLGREVRIVPSTIANLKITIPADLARAEKMLGARRKTARAGGPFLI